MPQRFGTGQGQSRVWGLGREKRFFSEGVMAHFKFSRFPVYMKTDVKTGPLRCVSNTYTQQISPFNIQANKPTVLFTG